MRKSQQTLQSPLALEDFIVSRQDPLDGIVLEDLHCGLCSFVYPYVPPNCCICDLCANGLPRCVAKLRCIGSSMRPEEAQNDLQRPQSPLRWMQLSLQIYDWT